MGFRVKTDKRIDSCAPGNRKMKTPALKLGTWNVKAVLNWAEHSVREQLCLFEMFKLAVRFIIDVFNIGEQLCSRPKGRRSDVRNVGSAGYGSMLLIG